VPILDQSGLKAVEATPWFGIVVRAGTPRDIIDQLNEAIRAALRKPEMEAHFAALSVELRAMSSDEFPRHIQAETEKWGRLLCHSGARAD